MGQNLTLNVTFSLDDWIITTLCGQSFSLNYESDSRLWTQQTNGNHHGFENWYFRYIFLLKNLTFFQRIQTKQYCFEEKSLFKIFTFTKLGQMKSETCRIKWFPNVLLKKDRKANTQAMVYSIIKQSIIKGYFWTKLDS